MSFFCKFACQKFNLVAIDGRECKQYTYRAPVFLMRILSACLSLLVVTVVQVTATWSRTDLIHRVAQESRQHNVCVLPQNSQTSTSNVICDTSLDYTEHVHSLLIFDTVFLTGLIHFSASLNPAQIDDVT